MASIFAKTDDADTRIDDIFDPSKVPGSSAYMASNGTDLGMQAIFAASFFTIFILLFSALRLRWPFIFSPRTRLTITSPPYLSRKFFGWFLATMRTPETYILNTLGLDTVIFLRFYKMCMRLLLDIAFFSIVIIWPINIYWSKINLDAIANVPDPANGNGDLAIPVSYSVTDYLFNLTMNTSDPKQQWYLVPHIVFVYIFSGLAYYHISKFSSRWASLRWHFLMQSRHALVSRTVMLTGVPRHLAKSPRELEWFWSSGLQLGKIEQVRVCPFNTRLTSSAKERARYLIKLEHAYKKLLGNPCVHPEYDPKRLLELAVDPSDAAREEERQLLEKWAKPSRQRQIKQPSCRPNIVVEYEQTSEHSSVSEKPPSSQASFNESERTYRVNRPTAWVRSGPGLLQPWKRVDAIDYWRTKYLAADHDFRQLRASILRGDDDVGQSTTAFVTFEDAATAHMITQLSCYPNPGYMKARLAPEPRGVYWPNVWIPNHRKWVGFAIKWSCILVIWAFWTVPVILFSSLLTPASLGKIFPAILNSEHNLLRAFLSTTVPSVFLLLFLNMLPWILKQVHFITGVRTKPDIDYSVMTKMWAFLMLNVILVFGFSGTFWNLIIDAVNRPGTIMQNLASNIPRVGTFFTGYILVLGVGYQPFKLLQLRPVIWHIGRQWLCSTPRDYARLVSPVYIDWYSVYPYPLLVFAIAMIYSTFSPPVVVGSVIYFAIGYPVMKYLLLYVYFHPFETAGMVWPKVCRRMILSIILYQVVMLTFVIVKGGGWYTFSLIPVIMLYMWFFYFLGWSLEKQGTVLPMYLWRNPPPNSSYPLPPGIDDMENCATEPYAAMYGSNAQRLFEKPNSQHAPLSEGRQAVAKMGAYRRGAGSGPRGSSSLNDMRSVPLPPPYQSQRPVDANSTSRLHGSSKLSRPLASLSPPPLPGKQAQAAQATRKRTIAHHRRESSRGARTREIIIAKRPYRTTPLSNSGSLLHRRKHRKLGQWRYSKRNPPIISHRPHSSGPPIRQTHGLPVVQNSVAAGKQKRRSSSKTASNVTDNAKEDEQLRHQKSEEYRVSKRRRYKSLAEVAALEGSRLLVSLGKLPAEVYFRHLESRRKSQAMPDALSSSEQPYGKRWASHRQRGRRDSVVESRNDVDASDCPGTSRQVFSAPHATSAESDEWEDVEPSDDLAVAGSRRQDKMTDIECCHTKESSVDWDPLLYLKPTDDYQYLKTQSMRPQAQADKTLGTLLTGIDHRSSSVSSSNAASGAPAFGLRRRNRASREPFIPDGSSGSMSVDSTSQAATSIIGAEGARHSEGTRRARGMRARVQQTIRQVRDYFMAEFRPAAPILDLTYDRLYSQGLDDEENWPRTNANGEYDDGDELPPLRQLIGRVLPRSVSRAFSPAPNESLLPPAIAGSATVPLQTRKLDSPNEMSDRLMPRASTAALGSLPSQSGRPTCDVTRLSGQSKNGGKYLHLVSNFAAKPAICRPNEGSQLLASADGAGYNDLSELPRPPTAPWLASEFGSRAAASSSSLRATSQPTQGQMTVRSMASSSAGSLPPLRSTLNADRQSSHKNSLPPPRVPLTARMVSELNYVTRRSITPSWIPQSLGQSRLQSPCSAATTNNDDGDDEPESEQLLAANYQKFAVERQSKFEPDEYTDYLQTPMLNFKGILDRGIQDYIHPGLVGELPTLWLPVKRVPDSDSNEQTGEPSHANLSSMRRNSRSPSVAENMQELAMSAPYRRIAALVQRLRADSANCTDSIVAVMAAAAAATDTDGELAIRSLLHPNESRIQQADVYSELQEVCVHPTPEMK
ncbi:hypothetical protein EV183_002351 [Coemansia sp. RSA 2336]|nr:hypothetical protein EV183_002351 [Coemansia sp. RSA 2336]